MSIFSKKMKLIEPVFENKSYNVKGCTLTLTSTKGIREVREFCGQVDQYHSQYSMRRMEEGLDPVDPSGVVNPYVTTAKTKAEQEVHGINHSCKTSSFMMKDVAGVYHYNQELDTAVISEEWDVFVDYNTIVGYKEVT